MSISNSEEDVDDDISIHLLLYILAAVVFKQIFTSTAPKELGPGNISFQGPVCQRKDGENLFVNTVAANDFLVFLLFFLRDFRNKNESSLSHFCSGFKSQALANINNTFPELLYTIKHGQFELLNGAISPVSDVL
jgi:hypothetical protein